MASCIWNDIAHGEINLNLTRPGARIRGGMVKEMLFDTRTSAWDAADDHGARAIPEHDSRRRHGRFPLPGPLPRGEGEKERLRRDFHGRASGDTSAPVQPIHCIPGRCRFRVVGLYRSLRVRHRLESLLRDAEGIRAVHGNELTGSLLVVFDRRKSMEDIARLITQTLEISPASAETGKVSATPEYRLYPVPVATAPALLSSQAPNANALSAGLVASSPLVLLPISFLRTFSTGLFHALPIVLLFTSSIAVLGLAVGKKEGWSRSDALCFAFATASTVGFNDLRPTQTSTKVLSTAIGLLGLLLTGIVTALGFLAAQEAFQRLP